MNYGIKNYTHAIELGVLMQLTPCAEGVFKSYYYRMRKETTWEDIGTYQNLTSPSEIKKKTKRQCVRCGVHLYEDQRLRCSKCINRVDEELNGLADRPLNYYFRWNLKHKK